MKSLDVFACPSNPFSRTVAGMPGTAGNTVPGMNSEGWEVEPEQRMPISYSMNSCASTWYPADTKEGQTSGALRIAQLPRPADTILVAEQKTIWPDTHPAQLWSQCYAIFSHPTGQVGVFIFHDGHAKPRKWLSTLYPITENNWDPQLNAPDRKCFCAPTDTFIGDYFGNEIAGSTDFATFVSTYDDGSNPQHYQQQVVATLRAP